MTDSIIEFETDADDNMAAFFLINQIKSVLEGIEARSLEHIYLGEQPLKIVIPHKTDPIGGRIGELREKLSQVSTDIHRGNGRKRVTLIDEMLSFTEDYVKNGLSLDYRNPRVGTIEEKNPSLQWGRDQRHVNISVDEADNIHIVIWFTPLSRGLPESLRIQDDETGLIITGLPPSIEDENMHNKSPKELTQIKITFEFIFKKISDALLARGDLNLKIDGLVDGDMRTCLNEIATASDHAEKVTLYKVLLTILKRKILLLEHTICTPKQGVYRELFVDGADQPSKKVYLPPAVQNALDKVGWDNLRKCIEIEDMKFFLSPLSRKGSKKVCLFFVLKGSTLYSRVAYKSTSGMKWRITSDFHDPGDNVYVANKGLYSYTTETVPCPELDDALYELECHQGNNPIPSLEMYLKEDPENDTYRSEIQLDTPPKGLIGLTSEDITYSPLNDPHWNTNFLNKPVPEDFIPDFSERPIEVRHRASQLEKGVLNTIETYAHRYQGEDWLVYMGTDPYNRVWVDKLVRKGGINEINTYGVRRKVLNLGTLSLKPFEYLSVARAMNPDKPVAYEDTGIFPNPEAPIDMLVLENNTTYCDLGPTLDRTALVNAYRKAKNTYRDYPSHEQPLEEPTGSIKIGEQDPDQTN